RAGDRACRRVSQAVVNNIVSRDVNPCRTDDERRPADLVMDRAAGAVVVNVTGKTPRVSRIITDVGMGGAAQVKEAAQVFAVDTRDGACRRVRSEERRVGEGCGVDASWTDDKCRSADPGM